MKVSGDISASQYVPSASVESETSQASSSRPSTSAARGASHVSHGASPEASSRLPSSLHQADQRPSITVGDVFAEAGAANQDRQLDAVVAGVAAEMLQVPSLQQAPGRHLTPEEVRHGTEVINAGVHQIEVLDNAVTEFMANASPAEQRVVVELHDFVNGGAAPTDPAAREMANEINRIAAPEINRLERATGRDLAPESRVRLLRAAVLNFLSANIDNPVGRAVASSVNVIGRTGAIVLGATIMRQSIAYGIRNALDLMPELARHQTEAVIGNLAMAIGPVLNIGGFIHDEVTGRATTATRVSRVAIGLASGGAIAVANALPSGTGTVLTSSMSHMAPAIVTYCVARDLIQPQVPFRTGTPGIDARAVATTSLLYGVNQFLVSTAMDQFPDSGGSYAASSRDVGLNSSHDAMRGLSNAGGEVLDDLTNAGTHAGFTGNRFQMGLDCPSPRERLARAIQGIVRTDMARQGLFMSAFTAAYATGELLARTTLSESAQGHLVNLVVGGTLATLYPAFMYVHATRPPPEATPAGQETMDPAGENGIARNEPDMELRQRSASQRHSQGRQEEP